MSRPRVSVLLPVRDEEPFLADCLASLSAQTLTAFEVVVVDDGSPSIAEEHARGDSRFRVMRQVPAGMVAASERAREEARAPLLARMDADDVALPERLELQVAAIEEEGLAAVGGRVSTSRPLRRCKVHFLRRTFLADGRPAVVRGSGPTGKAFAGGSSARDPRRTGRPRRARGRLPRRALSRRGGGAGGKGAGQGARRGARPRRRRGLRRRRLTNGRSLSIKLDIWR
ncbi:MAG TPA: glycosyltransferase family 2 protein [Gaiellaceae bacterium]|nr:glycosyltransferase family 2 protein [Gaiellaceae bacterium]